jgi:hypothetical protein
MSPEVRRADVVIPGLVPGIQPTMQTSISKAHIAAQLPLWAGSDAAAI